jgi:parallel beta-helix repeat protein
MLVTSYIVVISPVETVKASGNTLYVGGSGPGNYTRIQDAIMASKSGDTIFVYSGTYYENVLVDKTLVLVGEEKENTIIDGNKTDDVIKIVSDHVIINGFTIRNSGNDSDPEDTLNSDSGVDIQSNFVTISNNIISNNLIGLSTRGISSKNNLIINNNLFLYNNKNENKDSLAISCYGCYLMYTDYSKIYNNEFYYNANGIRFSYSDYNEIYDNKIINLTSNHGYGIYIKTSNYNIFSNNYIKNTSVGMWMYSLSDMINGNVICNNTIMDTFYALLMQFCFENNIYGNLIKNNEFGIHLNYSTNNIFYHNDFINNNEQTFDDMDNYWYNDSIEEGNFWDDYVGEDVDQNGVGDTPYNITGGSNQDRYPLIKPRHNIAPEKPIINGPIKGRINKEQDYRIYSTDINDDDIYYVIDWGDDQQEEYGPYASGEDFLATHIWEIEDTYIIKVKCKDKYNLESVWTILEVTMPKNKAINTLLFLQRFFQRFPFFEKILNPII